MTVSIKAARPPASQSKAGDIDALLVRMPAKQRLPRARAQVVLAALELVKDESWQKALERRGLKGS